MSAGVIAHYKIIKKLGAGGMGEVYLAEDLKLNRQVAIKFMPPDAENEEARKRFEREAKASARLDHPNICSVYEIGDDNGRPYIVMQYVEGETLSHKLKNGPLPVDEAINYAIQLAEALTEAHSRGILHRDIKPQNLMITERGQLKVLDFGLAKPVEGNSETDSDESLTEPGMVVGTISYMSPEQLRCQPLDGRSDIFSFGIVLYEMLSALQPFEAQNTVATISAILTEEPQPIGELVSVPEPLQRIIERCLKKHREQRYHSAVELVAALSAIKQDESEAVTRQQVAAVEPPLVTERYPEPVRQTQPEDEPKRPTVKIEGRSRRLLTVKAGAIGALVLVVAIMGGWFGWQRYARNNALKSLARAEELARASRFREAFQLVEEARPYLPDHEAIARLMPEISEEIIVETKPAGARVYLQAFDWSAQQPVPTRQFIGVTPIKSLVGRDEYVMEIEKEGYATIERPISSVYQRVHRILRNVKEVIISENLVAADRQPAGMVMVPGGEYELVGWGKPFQDMVRLDDFFIDKYEVSNKEFKEFIDAGGYLKPEYWQQRFIKDGKEIAWQEALLEFKDQSGLPGPRSWSNQNFPEGKADHPVTDISWYEAAAYAKFRGKTLPTVFQWEKAARNGKFTTIAGMYMPWGLVVSSDHLNYRANFNGNGTAAVDAFPSGISQFGCYNMAGNVDEWCLNEHPQGFLSVGGSWKDRHELFARYGAFPGFYSSNTRGFRCVLNMPGAQGDQGAFKVADATVVPRFQPVAEADFQTILRYYQYDAVKLDARVEEVKETEQWRREKISYVGSSDDRAIAYLYLPKNYPRPLQVIHYAPTNAALLGFPLADEMERFLTPYIKSGRAVFGVSLKGYSERRWPADYKRPGMETVKYREQMINWVTDLRRGLDYLETREDIDIKKLSFLGVSAGASQYGTIFAATDPRYRSVVFIGAGLRKSYLSTIAEANPINFVPYIKAPKLMIHGRYDEVFALKTDGEPMYNLLSQPKRLTLFEGGHVPPIEVSVPIVNNWLDEQLGSVKR